MSEYFGWWSHFGAPIGFCTDPAQLMNYKPKRKERAPDLGPKQLQWCRDNLANFAKYEQKAKASKGEP